MDFLKIRKKAKERAARAAAPAAGISPAPEPPEAGRSRSPQAPPVAATSAPVPGPEPRSRRSTDVRSRRSAEGRSRPPPEERSEPSPEERSGPAPAGEPSSARPSPPPLPLPGRFPAETLEALRQEAELGRRVSSLPPAADARFVTWRPDGAGVTDLAAIRPVEEVTPEPPAALARPLAPLDDFFYRDDEAAPGAGLVPSLPPGGELAAPVALEEYLLFTLGGETYGVEIGRVLEVLRSPQVTEVPRAPVDVRGVISVRGDVITLVDPRGRLGLARAEGPPARRVVIVDDGQGPCGLLVDGVAGVVRLPRGALEPCPQTLGSAGGELFVGIGRERDRLFLVIDLPAILRPLRGQAEGRSA